MYFRSGKSLQSKACCPIEGARPHLVYSRFFHGSRQAKRSRAPQPSQSAVNHFHSSHLEDELSLMQHGLELSGSDHLQPTSRHHEHEHANILSVHREHGHEDIMNDSLEEEGEMLQVCELDLKSDPVVIMQQLRKALIEQGSCILTVNDSRPDVLLDAVSMLHLLNQDLRLEEDFVTSIFFQPLLKDPKTLAQTRAIAQSRSSSMALLVTRSRSPEHLQKFRSGSVIEPCSSATFGASPPSSSLSVIPPSSTTSEVWDTAHELVGKLDTNALAKLNCCTARSIVVAFRALRRARRIVRLAGQMDLLVCPHIHIEHGDATISLICLRKRVAPAVRSTHDREHRERFLLD